MLLVPAVFICLYSNIFELTMNKLTLLLSLFSALILVGCTGNNTSIQSDFEFQSTVLDYSQNGSILYNRTDVVNGTMYRDGDKAFSIRSSNQFESALGTSFVIQNQNRTERVLVIGKNGYATLDDQYYHAYSIQTISDTVDQMFTYLTTIWSVVGNLPGENLDLNGVQTVKVNVPVNLLPNVAGVSLDKVTLWKHAADGLPVKLEVQFTSLTPPSQSAATCNSARSQANLNYIVEKLQVSDIEMFPDCFIGSNARSKRATQTMYLRNVKLNEPIPAETFSIERQFAGYQLTVLAEPQTTQEREPYAFGDSGSKFSLQRAVYSQTINGVNLQPQEILTGGGLENYSAVVLYTDQFLVSSPYDLTVIAFWRGLDGRLHQNYLATSNEDYRNATGESRVSKENATRLAVEFLATQFQ